MATRTLADIIKSHPQLTWVVLDAPSPPLPPDGIEPAVQAIFTSQGELLGVISTKQFAEHPSLARAQFLAQFPSSLAGEHTSLLEALQTLSRQRSQALGVIDDQGQLLGGVCREQLLQAVFEAGAPDEEQTTLCPEDLEMGLAMRLARFEEMSQTMRQSEECFRSMDELRQSRDRLQRVQLLYQGILRSTANGVCVINAEWIITFANHPMANIISPIPDVTRSLHGLPFETFFADATAFCDYVVAVHETVHASGSDIREMELRRLDGSSFWGEVSIVNLDPTQPASGWVATISDITNRKQAQEALAESERRYRSLVETSPDSIVLADMNMCIQLCNQQAASMHGFHSTDELIGKPFLDLVAPHDNLPTREQMRRLFETGNMRNFEHYVLRDDGTSFPVEISASLVYDEDGKPQNITGIARDITERKRTEREREVLSRLAMRLAAADTLEKLAAIIRSATEELWDWHALFLSVLWSGQVCFQTLLEIDTINGEKRCFPLSDYRIEGRGYMEPLLQGQPMLINCQSDEEIPGIERFGDTSRSSRSMMYVPIRLEGKVLGIFSIHSYTQDKFNLKDRDLLQRLADTVGPALERCRAEKRSAAFSSLGQRLSGARTPREAAKIVVEVADELLEWDACWVASYIPEFDQLQTILAMDLVDGQRWAEPPITTPVGSPPSLIARRTLTEGAQLLLREAEQEMEGLRRFGNRQQLSKSLMFVPIRSSSRVVGILSIQNYTSHAYNAKDLETLQALADHCAGALERTRAESAHVRLALAVEQASEAILIANTSWVIQYVNPAFERITGYTKEEALGRKPRELLDSGSYPIEFYEAIDAILAHNQVWSGHFVNRRKDGVLYEEEAAISPIRDDTGATVSYVAVKRDVTREKALENELRQSQKMEAIGLLAGGVAHDFNNLLQVIIGYVQLILRRAGHDDHTKNELEGIFRAAKRGASLTRQLLAFSRRQALQPQLLDLNQVVEGMEKLLRRVIGEDIELYWTLCPEQQTVNADPGQLEQVILNLAINARDAMSGGGKLTLQTGTVYLDEEYTRTHPDIPVGYYAMLSTSDTGCGMDRQTLSRIFEPFFSTKGVGKGTGLGLSTVYGIVKQSGGHIDVDSKVGIGTTFRIYLPLVGTPARLAENQPASPSGDTHGNETILLVEDDGEVRKLIRSMLESYGYAVHEACNGVEALRLLEQLSTPVDLLLSDMVMPEMGGLELERNLAVSHPAMKVLFLSGYTDNAVVKHALLEQGRAWIQKPVSAESLARKIREVLHEEKAAKP